MHLARERQCIEHRAEFAETGRALRVEAGKLADLVLWSPAFFGVKPELVIKGGMIVHAAMYAPQAAFFSELFGTDVRYTGASIGYQLASPLAGGLAPLICTALLQWSHGEPWPVAGRPPELVPYGHQVGRSALFAALTVLGPLLMILAGLSMYARFH